MIVVLTMGRSGSSLLMQTLKHLGVTVVGRDFRDNPSPAHIAMNPKGYLENSQLYYNGLQSETFGRLREDVDQRLAFKSDIGNFTSDAATGLWLDAVNKISCILVSVRTPSEQARSEFLGQEVTENAHLAELKFSVDFLKSYQQNFANFEAKITKQLSEYRARTHVVDYADARADPAAYVRYVAASSMLNPTPEALKLAAANIENGLYRVKQDDLHRTQGAWAKTLGAQTAYERTKALF